MGVQKFYGDAPNCVIGRHDHVSPKKKKKNQKSHQTINNTLVRAGFGEINHKVSKQAPSK